jgi:hypothetical protein
MKKMKQKSSAIVGFILVLALLIGMIPTNVVLANTAEENYTVISLADSADYVAGALAGTKGFDLGSDKTLDNTRFEGKFKFSYRTAQDVEIKVKQVAPVQIFLEQTSLNFDHRGGFSGIRYTILNATDLIKPSVTTDVKWIRVYDFDEDDFMFVVDENSKSDDRTGKITLTYGNVSASCIVYQEGSIWADWI